MFTDKLMCLEQAYNDGHRFFRTVSEDGMSLIRVCQIMGRTRTPPDDGSGFEVYELGPQISMVMDWDTMVVPLNVKSIVLTVPGMDWEIS